MVGLARFELATSPLSGVRSNQLSYRPFRRPVLLHGQQSSSGALLGESPRGYASRERPISPTPCRQAHLTALLAASNRNCLWQSLRDSQRLGRDGLAVGPVPGLGPGGSGERPELCSSLASALSEKLRSERKASLRKEVIQPQVPLRLPCYDFTPVADPTVVGCLLTVSAPPSGKTNSHGVTGGVYKARERIHRGMLFHDY